MKVSEAKISEVLKRAKALISTEEHWCKGVLARDVDGNEVSPQVPHAHSYCSLGAIEKIARASGVTRWWSVEMKASTYLELALEARVGDPEYDADPDEIIEFNDGKTHAEVMALWDSAIEKAEEWERKGEADV
jgi:hypothetical protein